MSSVPRTINCWSVSKGRGERALLQPGKVLLVSMALLVRLGGRGSSARGFLPVKWVLWHGTSLVAQSRGIKRLTHKHVPACAGVAVTAATLLSQPPPPARPSPGVHSSSGAAPAAFLGTQWTPKDGLLEVPRNSR